MSNIESMKFIGYQVEIAADMEDLFSEYRTVFYCELQNVNQNISDKLILTEMRKALDDIESKLALKPLSSSDDNYASRR